MNEYVILFAEHDRNHEWFRKRYEELVEKFDGEFVAIHKRRVIDHDGDLDKLMERVEGKYPIEYVFLEYVTKEKLVLVL